MGGAYFIGGPSKYIHLYEKAWKKTKNALVETTMWKIANEVSNPKKQSNWKLDINGKKVDSEQEIADCFNN